MRQGKQMRMIFGGTGYYDDKKRKYKVHIDLFL